MKQPLSLAFNAAVMAMASKVCPTGYDVIDNAPSSLEELTAYIARTGRMAVDGANVDNTIFADAECNYAFRAWHDWTHWVIQADFSIEGETRVAHQQMADLLTVFGPGPEFDLFCRLLDEEVIGQVHYFATHNAFPPNQREFAENYLGSKS